MTLESIINFLEYEKNLIKIRNMNDEDLSIFWGKKFSRSQSAEKIRKDLFDSNAIITYIDYRLFDKRVIFYTGKSDGFCVNPRRKISKHMIDFNDSFYLNKQDRLDKNSKTIDFAEYDKYMLSIIDDDNYTAFKHPWFSAFLQCLVLTYNTDVYYLIKNASTIQV
jgi:hypothetical protein